MSSSSSSTHDTEKVLIEAAGHIFSRKGFHATTVREITKKAGVNLAAVNYHFRDKNELYIRVFKHAHQAAARTAEADFAGAPRERLRAFIHAFLGYLLDPQRPEWQGRLIALEMAQPSQALDRLAKESFQPVKKRLARIVRAFFGAGVSESMVRRACFSIIGQCLFYIYCREMIARLFPQERHPQRDINALADHIFNFSLAGLAAVRSGKKKRRPIKHPPTKAQRKKSS